jgi:dipeptidase E
MFDRFSDRSKKVLSLARQAALRLDHECIGTEHMLLGLLEIEDGVAAAVLKDLGVDRTALRAEFEGRQQAGPLPVERGQLPFTPAAKGVLEEAMAEAADLGHHYIGSEHLLLGLLRSAGTEAEAALRGAGASHEAARAAVLDFPRIDDDARAHDQPDGPPGSLEPSSEARKRRRLLLISNSTMHGGEYLEHCKGEIRDLLGSDERRVAFVPYALADHDGYEAKAKAAFAAIGHELSSVHHDADPRAAVRDAEAVFVGGGNTFRLLEMLYRTRLLFEIRALALAGMPYIGSSAGTNVAALSIKTTNDMPIVRPPLFAALSLVPFQINPHYLDPDPGSKHMGETREERLLQFHEENDTEVLALREGCMLRVEGELMELRGTTGARLFRRGQPPAEFTPPCDLSFLLKARNTR